MPVRQLASHVHSAMYEWVQSKRESMPRRRKTRRRAIWPKHSTQARASSPHNHNLSKALGRVRVRPSSTFELTGTSPLISGLFVLDQCSHRLSPIPLCRQLAFPSQLAGLPSLVDVLALDGPSESLEALASAQASPSSLEAARAGSRVQPLWCYLPDLASCPRLR